MALRRCSAHGQFFPGPAESAYPAILVGTESERTKLKLCQRCFAAWSDEVLAVLTEVTEDEPEWAPASSCNACKATPGNPAGLFPVFVTWYPKGLGRRDAYGVVCQACTQTWGQTLLYPHAQAPGVLLRQRNGS